MSYVDCAAGSSRPAETGKTMTASTKRQIEFHVRCAVRRGRSWENICGQIRRAYGWGLEKSETARNAYNAAMEKGQ